MNSIYELGDFSLDPVTMQLSRGGKTVSLGNRAAALLKALLEAKGSAVSKTALMDAAWPGLAVEEVNLSVQIAALRKVLGTRPDGDEWIATVPRVGYRLSRPPSMATRPVGPETRVHSGAAIAVLPFENMSADPEQEYFADGVVEDLITSLSRFKTFAVVSRNSSFVYKGRAVDVRQAGHELGVRYVLEGSVRRSANQVRVAAQLVEVEGGTHLWAEKFDGPLDDIFDVQDRITEAVVGHLEPTLRRAEIERARTKRPENLDAYDLFLRALPSFYGVPEDGWAGAIDLLDRAIELEPDFALALAHCAWAHEKRNTAGIAGADPNRAIDLAHAALKVAGENHEARIIAVFALMIVAGQTRLALEVAREARRANPNHASILGKFGQINMIADGDPGESLEALHLARQLSPGAPELYEVLTHIGWAHYFRGELEEAIVWLRKSLATAVEWQPTYWGLAAAHAQLGQMDDAREAVARERVIAPGMTLAGLEEFSSRGDGMTRFAETMLRGLRLAGMPES